MLCVNRCVMSKAIHLKNERQGISRRGLTKVVGERNGWRSCCWLLTDEEQDALIGGWLYLHETKSTPSQFGGMIIGFEPAERDGAARSNGVAIVFRADSRARDQGWRGANHGMAWTSGVLEGDLPHEQGGMHPS